MKTFAFVAALLCAAFASAQDLPKVWTNDDLRNMKHPINSRRRLTQEELDGIKARAYVAPPTFPPGPTSYGTRWTPADDRPDRGVMPTWYTTPTIDCCYASQPLWPWTWYPYPIYQRPLERTHERPQQRKR